MEATHNVTAEDLQRLNAAVVSEIGDEARAEKFIAEHPIDVELTPETILEEETGRKVSDSQQALWDDAQIQAQIDAWLDSPCSIPEEIRNSMLEAGSGSSTGFAGSNGAFLDAVAQNSTAEAVETFLRDLIDHQTEAAPGLLDALFRAYPQVPPTVILPYLRESVVTLDWNHPQEKDALTQIDCFIEAAELAQKYLPKEFYALSCKIFPICPPENELLLELTASSLICHTEADRLPTLLQTTVAEDFNKGTELLFMLCHHGIRSDDIYRTLKTLFKQAVDGEYAEKETLAYILGEYGDARAIPVLRRYAETVRQDLQTLRQTQQNAENSVNADGVRLLQDRLYSVINSVSRLGGEARDLYEGVSL